MAFTLALILDHALRDAGIPIDGVSVGDPTDRTTWKACYPAVATAAQRAQGDSILATLAPDDPTTVANIKNDLAVMLTDLDVDKALATALYECIPAPTKTPVQLRARIIALLKA